MKMPILHLIAGLLLSTELLAEAAPCMPINAARGVAVSGPLELVVDGGERAWVIELSSACPAALGARKIRFLSSANDRQICPARSDSVSADGTQCGVAQVHQITPELMRQAVAAIRQVPQAAPPVCFDPREIRKWRQLDRRTLLVDVRRQGQFVVHLANACGDLVDANDARFLPSVGRDFCGYHTDQVVPVRAPTALGPTPRLFQSRIERQGCPVLRVERYVPAPKS